MAMHYEEDGVSYQGTKWVVVNMANQCFFFTERTHAKEKANGIEGMIQMQPNECCSLLKRHSSQPHREKIGSRLWGTGH